MAILGPIDPVRAVGLARSGAARLARLAQADHLTLDQRSLRSYSGVMTHAFLHVAVAPSRRLRGGQDRLVDLASLLAAALGLPTVPYLADASSQRFVEEDHLGHARSLLVTRTGVLEMLWALEQVPCGNGAWAVRASDACAQLGRFARLVRSDDYGRLLGRSRHSRVDWTLGVTPTTVGDTGQRGWRDIIVIGVQPARASGHLYGFMPPNGYGSSRLRGVKRSLGPEQIMRVMLEEWLQANGYLRISDAVDRTIDEAIAAQAAV